MFLFHTIRKLKKAGRLARVPLWRDALKQGVAAAIEHRQIFTVEKVGTLIDGGANRGQFSLLIAGMYPQARIFAFEPLKAPQDIYRRIFKGNDRVTLYPCALGTEAGSATINVAQATDSSSLLDFGEVEEMFPSARFSHQETIPVERLDAVLTADDLQAPVLLKLDVQGFELEVLRGTGALLEQIDAVYVEASLSELYKGQCLFDDLYRFLLDAGFTLTRIGHITGVPANPGVQGVFVFVRRAVESA